ncbi:MAG: sulfatase-like hydrolase/transferase [Bacteroidota bacterium]
MITYNSKGILIFIPALFAVGCTQQSSEEAEQSKPNILWITAEDIGPALGCYGDPQARTPNLDELASDGVVYNNAYANAPISAPARSSLITGMHATSLGTQHLRSDIPIPDKVKGIPEYLDQAGYFCTNSGKTDYNFSPAGMWDHNGTDSAHWEYRPEGDPFFSVFNYGVTHEGHVNKYQPEDYKNLEKRHDPEKINLPPYFPDTPEMRKLWARQYDLITVLDKRVGDLIDQLKEDGLYDETIIFFYADHGYGMPRYKRWLYKSGLHVPMIVRVPEKYRHLIPKEPGSKSDRMVSFVDLAPTVLNLADVDIPDHMQGKAFLGNDLPEERQYLYASRSRADDVYDVSRAILSDDYIYIRNYMPHHSYVTDALIFDEEKASFRELRRLRKAGKLTGYARKFFQPKPDEELYNLEEDPHELNNIADSSAYSDKLKQMRKRLKNKIISTRDIGFLNEAEMMRRARASTPYEYAQSEDYQLKNILNTAEKVGKADLETDELIAVLSDKDSGVRFWGVVGLIAHGEQVEKAENEVKSLLDDPSPIVQIKAAELLCKWNRSEKALPVLEKHLKARDKPWLVLQAAISLRRIGEKAKPLESVVKSELQRYKGDTGRGYSSWSYPMFIGFALDQVIINVE